MASIRPEEVLDKVAVAKDRYLGREAGDQGVESGIAASPFPAKERTAGAQFSPSPHAADLRAGRISE
jgi:hypothetical protein